MDSSVLGNCLRERVAPLHQARIDGEQRPEDLLGRCVRLEQPTTDRRASARSAPSGPCAKKTCPHRTFSSRLRRSYVRSCHSEGRRTDSVQSRASAREIIRMLVRASRVP